MLAPRLAADDAGVVDEDVDAARTRRSCLAISASAAARSLEIGGQQFACGGRLSLADPLAAVCVAGCSLLMQRRRPRRPRASASAIAGAEAARRAGHERHLAVEPRTDRAARQLSAALSPGRKSSRGGEKMSISTTSSSSIVAPCSDAGRKQQHVTGARGARLSFDEEVGAARARRVVICSCTCE